MITLTFPWWAALLVLSFWTVAGQLGERAGTWLYRRMSYWRIERERRREEQEAGRAGA